MAKCFYADCVITDINLFPGSKMFEVVSAKVDGRQVDRMIIPIEMQRYFMGLKGEVKNRVWFAAVSFLGSKTLVVQAVENPAGERHVEKQSLWSKFYDIVIRSACVGFFAWMATWVIGIIPAEIFARHGMESLFEPAIWIGVITAAVWSVFMFRFCRQLANTESWPAGDLSRYGKAVKPVFGAGLAAAKQ